MSQEVAYAKQELIRRWDSERELFTTISYMNQRLRPMNRLP